MCICCCRVCTSCGKACQCPKALSRDLHGKSVDTGILLTATGPVRIYGEGKTQYPMTPRDLVLTCDLMISSFSERTTV